MMTLANLSNIPAEFAWRKHHSAYYHISTTSPNQFGDMITIEIAHVPAMGVAPHLDPHEVVGMISLSYKPVPTRLSVVAREKYTEPTTRFIKAALHQFLSRQSNATAMPNTIVLKNAINYLSKSELRGIIKDHSIGRVLWVGKETAVFGHMKAIQL